MGGFLSLASYFAVLHRARLRYSNNRSIPKTRENRRSIERDIIMRCLLY
jgi:hypothetical protein